jgi:hypothetical protein
MTFAMWSAAALRALAPRLLAAAGIGLTSLKQEPACGRQARLPHSKDAGLELDGGVQGDGAQCPKAVAHGGEPEAAHQGG